MLVIIVLLLGKKGTWRLMKMELTSATGSLKNDLMCEESKVDIRIVTESDLMCEELITDVPLVMEPAQWPQCCIYRSLRIFAT